jgi:hypothetical protein
MELQIESETQEHLRNREADAERCKREILTADSLAVMCNTWASRVGTLILTTFAVALIVAIIKGQWLIVSIFVLFILQDLKDSLEETAEDYRQDLNTAQWQYQQAFADIQQLHAEIAFEEPVVLEVEDDYAS